MNVFGDVAGFEGAQIVIRDVSGQTGDVRMRSGADGRFSAALEPGPYAVEIFADFMEGMPTWKGDVRVSDGRMATVPTCRSSNPALLRRPVERRLRVLTRAEAERLRLARHSAGVDVIGTHAAKVTELFGLAPSLPPGRHVYVVILEGAPTAASPKNDAVTALRRGGYLAMLVSAGDLMVRATHPSRSPWTTGDGAALSSSGVNGFLAN